MKLACKRDKERKRERRRWKIESGRREGKRERQCQSESNVVLKTGNLNSERRVKPER